MLAFACIYVCVNRKAIAHTVTDLSDVLRDQTAYHLSLKVINAAGVTTIATSPFSVNVMPPPVSDVRPGVDNVTEHLSVSGESVAFVERTDTLGVQLPTLDSRAASVKFWGRSLFFLCVASNMWIHVMVHVYCVCFVFVNDYSFVV